MRDGSGPENTCTETLSTLSTLAPCFERIWCGLVVFSLHPETSDSEQRRRKFATPFTGSRVIGTHYFKEVDEPLSSRVVGLDLT